MLLFRFTKSKKWATYIYSFLFLPGIIFHELSHFLAALFLLVPTGKVNFNPSFNETEEGKIKEIKLGSVAIARTDPVRGTLIGFAPFIFGVSLILLTVNFVVSRNLFSEWVAVLISVYIIFELGNMMFLSKSDIKSAIQLTLILIIFYLILYAFGVRFSFNPQGLLSQTIIGVIKSADKFLLAPIGIDFLLFSFTKIFKVYSLSEKNYS